MDTSDIKKGLKLLQDGQPYVVVDFQFVKPGKGQSFTRCRIRNLVNGNVVERTWKSGESVELADVGRQLPMGLTLTFTHGFTL